MITLRKLHFVVSIWDNKETSKIPIEPYDMILYGDAGGATGQNVVLHVVLQKKCQIEW
jgi:hypothetical protein